MSALPLLVSLFGKAKRTKFCSCLPGCVLTAPSQLICAPTWQVVDVASVHQEMPVLRVAERRHVPGEGHAGTDVPPQRACGKERERQQH